MDIKLDVDIKDSDVIIKFDDGKNYIKILNITNTNFNNKIDELNESNKLYLFLDNDILMCISEIIDFNLLKKVKFNKVIKISNDNNLDILLIKNIFLTLVSESGLKLEYNDKINLDVKAKKDQEEYIKNYIEKVSFILNTFGYDLFKISNKMEMKEKSSISKGKTRHKWTKEISKLKFSANLRGGYGEVIWNKREEFILFKSPNQLGLFLFFGGQNTWEELKDETGKSLDELSKV